MCASVATSGRGIGGHRGHIDCFHLRNDVFITQWGPDLSYGKARLLKIFVLGFGKRTIFLIFDTLWVLFANPEFAGKQGFFAPST